MGDRLLPVREYSQSEPAHADAEPLRRLGIEAYVKRLQWPAGHYAVMVEESDADRARVLLADCSPHLTTPVPDSDPALRCPYCSSPDVLPQPPYPLIAVIIGFGAVAACLYVNSVVLALAAGVTTVVVASLAFGKAARWRCGGCGRRYGGGT